MSDQSATCEPAPPAEHWVELRIHGVSGTPPESMLESAHVKQVAGDSWGRFFRPVNGVGDEEQPCPRGVPDGRVLEGYHWGRYTSGSWIKGLWLILIPFGLVNAAAFMCPRPTGRLQRSLRFAIQSLIRGVGIGVTATFALAASLICIDVLAYQWAADLDVLHKLGFGRVLGLGVVLAAVTVTTLFVLGNQNRISEFGDAEDDSVADAANPVDENDPPQGLTRLPFFFVDKDSSPVLGRLHLAAGFCVVIVVATLLWDTVVPADTMATRTSTEDGLRHWALVLLVLVTVATAIGGDVGGAVRGTPLGKKSTWVMEMSGRVALAASLAMLVAAAWILTSVDRSDTPLNVDSYTQWLALISGLTMVLLFVANAALAAVTWPTSATPDPFRRYAFGMAPWAATSAGVFLAVGFCSASVLGIAKAVGSTADTEFIHRVSYSWGITAVLGLLMALTLAGLWWVRSWSLVARATAAYTAVGAPLGGPGSRWWGKIARAMSMAKLKFCVAPPLVIFAFSGLAMTFVTFAEMRSGDDVRWIGWLSETEPVPTRADPDPTVPTHVAFFTNLGTLTLIGLAGLLFYLGRRSLRAENTRRGANVLWDVLSFWPHAAHPFVPPAYSQFAVHDLRRRIVFHLSSPVVPQGQPKPPPRATSVVISAHSQGSLVTLAALLWLSPEHLSKVGLVTYGSQLQVAYPRGFPAFVDVELLQRVQESLGRRWVNLYRETDPIAGPVLSWHRTRMTAPPIAGGLRSKRLESPLMALSDTFPDSATGRRESGHDWRVLDPPPVDEQRQLAKLTLLGRHSGYPSSDDYPAALTRVKPA